MGRLLLTHGVPNDRTRLYWRSSIGLPMQQLKPGGAGGGWICTANRKSTLWGCAKCSSNASRLLQTSIICEWFGASAVSHSEDSQTRQDRRYWAMVLGDGGHGTTGMCGIEHRGARAVGGDRG